MTCSKCIFKTFQASIKIALDSIKSIKILVLILIITKIKSLRCPSEFILSYVYLAKIKLKYASKNCQKTLLNLAYHDFSYSYNNY